MGTAGDVCVWGGGGEGGLQCCILINILKHSFTCLRFLTIPSVLAGVQSSIPDFYEKMKEKLRTPEQGADTVVWLAVAPPVRNQPSGLFFQGKGKSLAETSFDILQCCITLNGFLSL